MRMLHKLIEFGINTKDLILFYILYIRSVCEQSAVVWHSSLTVENDTDIERIQKTALKIIFKSRYESYENALLLSDLETLSERRKQLCLTFAKRCLKDPDNDITKSFFQTNLFTHGGIRQPEKFKVDMANRKRTQQSPLIYMQHLLNEDSNKKKK